MYGIHIRTEFHCGSMVAACILKLHFTEMVALFCDHVIENELKWCAVIQEL